MKLLVCDYCHAEEKATPGETVTVEFEDRAGSVELCEKHRAQLLVALEPFLAASRIALDDPLRCPGCHMVSTNISAAKKHRTKCPKMRR